MKIDHLLRSRRKTLAIYVRSDGSIEVRAPKNLSLIFIQKFVDSKADWITNKRSKLQSRASSRTLNGYANGSRVWLLGQALTLEYTSVNNNQIKVSGNKLVIPARLQPEIDRKLIEFYRENARRVFTERVEYFAKQNGLRYAGIRINSARTRWGSCGAKNQLNFPYRLVMAPLEIIDYVVVHELAHTVERNHGPAFWAKVAYFLPDYKVRRKWLKTNGHLLDLAYEADPDRVILTKVNQPNRRRKPK
jgi:predicted metal-dependent hydrolase